MFMLLFFGIIGFAIGRVITLCISSFFHQRNYLNEACANTMIILGSGGEFNDYITSLNFYKNKYYFRPHNRNAGNSQEIK